MDIEWTLMCERDVLLLLEGAGDQAQSVHRYCLSEPRSDHQDLAGENQERFFKQISHSRYFTLIWKSDKTNERKGWKLEYEFVSPNTETCGFISNAATGVIHSPGYPNNYAPDLECIWDIIVPRGYHVKLEFETFDVQTTEKCDADYIVLSQEHEAQSFAPQGDYYFMFNNEQKEDPLCGINLPKVFKSESNRIR
ncbi:unnamed protein product, partial [Mesorhabditis belari]|uniref:CUB domain-containing protein n=1 Tax=Mesorhabditis belari TaxID=2138241 RepID=A0AAF3EW34_9BILA